MKKTFSVWLKKYRILKKSYTTYAFIAIKIKNIIAQDCFDSLKTNSLYQKNKRLADKYYERTLKDKLLNTMSNKRITNDKYYEVSSKIITTQIYKVKSSAFKAWFELYKEKSSKRMKVRYISLIFRLKSL